MRDSADWSFLRFLESALGSGSALAPIAAPPLGVTAIWRGARFSGAICVARFGLKRSGVTVCAAALSWPRAIQAAYYTTRASIAWAPKENDPRTTRRYIRKFYKLARKHGSGFKFDPRKVGDREFVYWDLHRRYSGRPYEEKQPYVRCLAELHSDLFGIPLEAAWPSAENRALGTDHIDEVTGRRSSDIEADWRKAEEYLREAYRSVRAQV